MPTPTYTPLATITLGSSASSVTFSSIPATYRDLILVAAGGGFSTTRNVRLRFNSDSGSNYSHVEANGNGSSAASSSATATAIVIGAMSEAQSNSVWQILDYSATDKHKSVLTRANIASVAVWMAAERWANTSAITSIQVFATENLPIGFTWSLYGIVS
jgi:hypothetical protein